MKTLTKIFSILLLLPLQNLFAQDLLDLVEDKPKKEFVTNAFKSTRVINTHSVEFLGAGVLDVRILHRFGTFNSGLDNLYGFDQANMRLGFDYGISKRLMIGVGRSNVQKELDGFIKYRLIWQGKGPGSWPISVAVVSGATMNTMPWADPNRVNFETSRLAFYYQVMIARKFSESFTLQLTPSIVHTNLVPLETDPNDVYSVGIGGRLKLSRRISFNWDYHFVLPTYQRTGYYNYAGIGFDIETGGHVFQLHVTNSVGMNERAFITNTTDDISSMGLRLGFNLSRVFTLTHKDKK